jgi:bifunctional DNA-binding transcriptional regulator/antitoxin component of YhaV-PrlF toxin-antitoxin module
MPEPEPTTRIVRQLRSGQITIPSDFRRQLGIDETSYLQITLAQGELRITPLRVADPATGSTWLSELYDHFTPTREIAARQREEEINADIDRAVAAVRTKDDSGRL